MDQNAKKTYLTQGEFLKALRPHIAHMPSHIQKLLERRAREMFTAAEIDIETRLQRKEAMTIEHTFPFTMNAEGADIRYMRQQSNEHAPLIHRDHLAFFAPDISQQVDSASTQKASPHKQPMREFLHREQLGEEWLTYETLVEGMAAYLREKNGKQDGATTAVSNVLRTLRFQEEEKTGIRTQKYGPLGVPSLAIHRDSVQTFYEMGLQRLLRPHEREQGTSASTGAQR